MAAPPRISKAQTPLNPDEDLHIILQKGKRTTATNREVLAGAQTIKGDPGPSAYQIAVAGGFRGSEADWLAALHGKDGQSAYQVAVANGFAGTQAQWLASLKGADATPPLTKKVTTDSTGKATWTFPAGTFTKVPTVVATAEGTGGVKVNTTTTATAVMVAATKDKAAPLTIGVNYSPSEPAAGVVISLVAYPTA
jgi:hypothetical protein